jgi:hypothetical protein
MNAETRGGGYPPRAWPEPYRSWVGTGHRTKPTRRALTPA